MIQIYKSILDACNEEELELPILEVREVKKISLVVVTGDRGLCGSYNSVVIKAATARLEKLKEQGIGVILFLNVVLIDDTVHSLNVELIFMFSNNCKDPVNIGGQER